MYLFIKHWRTTGPVNIRVSFSMFTNTKIELPYLEGKWFKSFQQFLSQQQINITLDINHVPKLQQENDCHIMDHIIKFSTRYTTSTYKTKVKQMHYC